MDNFDFSVIWLTLKLATTTTIVLVLIGLPLAWWLSRSRGPIKTIISVVTALPLVLPPTVLGFYLLIFIGPHGPLGKLAEALGLGQLPFTFAGLVLGSVLYSLPFVVQPIQNAFETLGSRPFELAATMRANPIDRFFTIALPMARPGILSAAVLGFAHTVGEFGVILMIGGNIPGQTRVLSIAIYDHVESLEYAQAHFLSGIMIFFSFLVLLFIYSNRRPSRLVA